MVFDDANFSQIRCRLIRYFAGNGADNPDDLASETMLRAVRNQAAGVIVESLEPYCLGIAHNVWLENCRSRNRQPSLPDWLQALAPAPPHAEPREACLKYCLKKALTRDEANLIQAYYGYSGAKPDHRQLAEDLRISEQQLRLRAFRIRRKLQSCIQHCMAKRNS